MKFEDVVVGNRYRFDHGRGAQESGVVTVVERSNEEMPNATPEDFAFVDLLLFGRRMFQVMNEDGSNGLVFPEELTPLD